MHTKSDREEEKYQISQDILEAILKTVTQNILASMYPKHVYTVAIGAELCLPLLLHLTQFGPTFEGGEAVLESSERMILSGTLGARERESSKTIAHNARWSRRCTGKIV